MRAHTALGETKIRLVLPRRDYEPMWACAMGKKERVRSTHRSIYDISKDSHRYIDATRYEAMVRVATANLNNVCYVATICERVYEPSWGIFLSLGTLLMTH